jgi:hypothetical protein
MKIISDLGIRENNKPNQIPQKIPNNSNLLNNGESHAQEAFIDKLVHTA